MCPTRRARAASWGVLNGTLCRSPKRSAAARSITASCIFVTFSISFKRSGELFGKPKVVTFAQPVTDEQRGRYYTAVAEALDLCSRLPFTDQMGGAVAGRVFRVNFLDKRNSRKAQIWLTTKTG